MSLSSLLPTLSVLGAPAETARVVRPATGPVGLWLQLLAGGRRPGARSAGWCLARERSRSRSHRLRERPRLRKLLRARSAIGRVAASAGALEGVGALWRRRAAGRRPGGVSGALSSRKRWTRQQRLPSTWAPCQPFGATGIDAGIALTEVSDGISLITNRRADLAAVAISSCIPADGCLSAPKNDPRDVGASGGLVTTDWTGYGDDSSLR